jgi:hypothetical protein
VLQSVFVLWPYLLAAAAVLLWLAILRRRIDKRVQYVIVAFVVCTLVNMVIEFACAYLVPLDIAGTPPPDVRNVRLRLLITAAIQVPVSLVLAYYIAARTKIDRWQKP